MVVVVVVVVVVLVLLLLSLWLCDTLRFKIDVVHSNYYYDDDTTTLTTTNRSDLILPEADCMGFCVFLGENNIAN